jgi:MEMO1 family protein
MKNNSLILFIVLLFATMACCNKTREKAGTESTRPLKDTVGFAQYPWQMDSLMSRIERAGWKNNPGSPLKLAICPHDDYTYVGKLYPELLQNVKAPNLILIGVAHKAAQFKIENRLVFDSFKYWKGPWEKVPVSPAREELCRLLTDRYAIVNDSLQKEEHSLESMIPFLQYFNRDISIVPLLVPAMSPARMKECGKALAEALSVVAANRGWEWGRDFAIIVTTDAVHYGNEQWGGKDMAFYGCDEAGNKKAVGHEYEIIDSCLRDAITPGKIRLFSSYTLNDSDYKEYKWTWCGRYCLPVALYTSFYLDSCHVLHGELTGYSTSITSPHVMVDDIGMGRTAIATNCHWVGYAALGYP